MEINKSIHTAVQVAAKFADMKRRSLSASTEIRGILSTQFENAFTPEEEKLLKQTEALLDKLADRHNEFATMAYLKAVQL